MGFSVQKGSSCDRDCISTKEKPGFSSTACQPPGGLVKMQILIPEGRGGPELLHF